MTYFNLTTALTTTIKYICFNFFDGLLQWNTTNPGETALQYCPTYIIGWSRKNTAHKECTLNGKWDKNITRIYQDCIHSDYQKFRFLIDIISYIGVALSFATTLGALYVALVFRLRRNSRTKLYKSIMCAQVLDTVCGLFYTYLFKSDVTILLEHPNVCTFFHAIQLNIDLTTYAWQAAQLLHAYNSLVIVIYDESFYSNIYLMIGWGAPFVITAIYISLRFYLGDTNGCMRPFSYAYFSVNVPLIVTLLVATWYIIKMWRKLAANSDNVSYSGIYINCAIIILNQFHFSTDSTLDILYTVALTVLEDYQGFAVAMVYLYVHPEIRRKVRKRWFGRRNESLELQQISAAPPEIIQVEEHSV